MLECPRTTSVKHVRRWRAGGQRQTIDGLMVHDAGLSSASERSRSMPNATRRSLALPACIGAQVDDPAERFSSRPVCPACDARRGATPWRSLPVQAREVGEQLEPIVLHRPT